MSAEDVRINAQVRRVFAQLWIDVTHLSHRTVRGNVHLSGRIVRVGGTDVDGDAGVMQRLHEIILAIPGVEGAKYSLDNWMFDGTGWKLIGAARGQVKRAEEKAKARKEAVQKDAGDEIQATATDEAQKDQEAS